MSADLAAILAKVNKLSRDELLALQDHISQQLSESSSRSTTLINDKQIESSVIIPGAYRPRREEVEASIAALCTPEELAEMDLIDFDNLPSGNRSLSQMVNEDREDRF